MNTVTNNPYIRLKLLDDSQVNGLVNLNREPGFERISDLILSRQEPFLVLSQASLYGNDLQAMGRKEVLLIKKTSSSGPNPVKHPDPRF